MLKEIIRSVEVYRAKITITYNISLVSFVNRKQKSSEDQPIAFAVTATY